MKQNAFLTCSWRFLRSDILEQLVYKLEKNVGISKSAGKVSILVMEFLLRWVEISQSCPPPKKKCKI